MGRADEMASEISKVDRDELLKRLEDEDLFNKSFASEISVSSKTWSKPEISQENAKNHVEKKTDVPLAKLVSVSSKRT